MSRRHTPRSPVAIALLRVSKGRKIQELGLDAQRTMIATWAARAGVEVVVEHIEEVSGGAPLEKRPVLAAALADVEKHNAAHLVALKVDRFSRDRIETGAVELALRRMGAELVFADGVANGTSPADEFTRSLMFAHAQFERATIRSRIVAALGVKKDRGEMVGAPPYGMRAVDGPMRARRDGSLRSVKMLETHPEEQTTLARARALRNDGKSIRAVCAALADEGRMGRSGKPFTVAAMHAMLATASAA